MNNLLIKYKLNESLYSIYVFNDGGYQRENLVNIYSFYNQKELCEYLETQFDKLLHEPNNEKEAPVPAIFTCTNCNKVVRRSDCIYVSKLEDDNTMTGDLYCPSCNRILFRLKMKGEPN